MTREGTSPLGRINDTKGNREIRGIFVLIFK